MVIIHKKRDFGLTLKCFCIVLFAGILVVFVLFRKMILDEIPSAPEKSVDARSKVNRVEEPQYRKQMREKAPTLLGATKRNTNSENPDAKKFLAQVEELLLPYSVLDATNPIDNRIEREDAALTLLNLLNSGKPEFLDQRYWDSLVSRIIFIQGESVEGMKRCVDMVMSWIDDRDRNSEDSMLALATMTKWTLRDSSLQKDLGYDLPGKVASMQMSLLSDASPSSVVILIARLASAQKPMQTTSSRDSRMIVSAKQLAGLVDDTISRFPDNVQLRNALTSTVSSRIESEPKAIVELDLLLHDMLDNKEIGDVQKLSAYRAISSQKKLPSWISDDVVLQYLESLRNQNIQKEGTRFADSLVVDICEARIKHQEDDSNRGYKSLLLNIVRDANRSDSFIRLKALQTLVQTSEISEPEAIIKFGEDPEIGDQVMDKYSSH